MSESQEAILFMGRGARIVKQMTYMEFEAILDGVVGLTDLAGKDMHAVYIVVNHYLELEGCVAFLISFDDSGLVDPGWNIPLRKMLYTARKKVTHNKLKINIVDSTCSPQKSVEGSLWSFEKLGGVDEVLENIVDIVDKNTLGLIGTKREVESTPDEFGQQAGMQQSVYPQVPPMAPMGHPMPGHPMQGHPMYPQQMYAPPGGYPYAGAQPGVDVEALKKSLNEEHSRKFNEYKIKAERKLSEYQIQLERLKGQLKTTLVAYKSAQQVQAESEQDLQRIEDEAKRYKAIVDEKIPRLKNKYSTDMASLKEKYETEILKLKKHVKKLTNESEKELGSAEEGHAKILAEKEDTIRNLREELCDFRRDKMRLMVGGTDKFFDRMKASGLKMVAYHPGAGHMNIPVDDLPEYIEGTDAYVAKSCGVTEEVYVAWRDHHNAPACGYDLGNGQLCGETIERMNDPKLFSSGVHDRCLKHRSAVSYASMSKASAAAQAGTAANSFGNKPASSTTTNLPPKKSGF